MTLSFIVRRFIFTAIAAFTVAVQIQTVIGQLDTMLFSNFTLKRFNGFITKFDHFAAIQANQMIVMMLLRQLKDRFAAFEIMAGNNTGIIKLVQYTVNRC